MKNYFDQHTALYFNNVIINGHQYYTLTDPLFDYLNSLSWKLINKQLFRYLSHKSYRPEWEIKNNKLFLTNMTIEYSTPEANARFKEFLLTSGVKPGTYFKVKDLFPGQDEVFAEWYSGRMIIEGSFKHLFPEYDICERYTREMFIDIDKGNVTRIGLNIKRLIRSSVEGVFFEYSLS